ncbi:hypothetical protein N9L19_01315 [bacterium]|nr:hypothetical protein [bacterium]
MAPKLFTLRPRVPTVKAKTAAKKKEKAGPVCQWFHAEPLACEQCEQDAHSFERDAPADQPFYLLWTKKKTTNKRVEYPVGSECYICFATRRRLFGITMGELKAKRETMKDLDDKWNDLRRGKATKEHKFNNEEKVDIYKYIEKRNPPSTCSSAMVCSTNSADMRGVLVWMRRV